MDHAAGNEADGLLGSRPGFFPLDGWTTVRVAGKDRASFLHNMCTNDIRGLAEGAGCEAFFTDVKGKIVAHAFVLAAAEEILLAATPGLGEVLVAHLDRYIIREDVQLTDQTSEAAWTLAAGQGAVELVGRLAAWDDAAAARPWAHRAAEVADCPVRLVRCALPWTGGFLMACPAALADHLHRQLEAAGVARAGDAAWQGLRIESGWPLEGVDFDGSNLPQEVGRDAEAINFRKGCYLGQETIARLDALGHVNKRLTTVRIGDAKAPVAAGAELFADGNSVGRVTSSAWSSALGTTAALAMIKRGFYEPGQKLTAGDAPAEVIATPAAGPSLPVKTG